MESETPRMLLGLPLRSFTILPVHLHSIYRTPSQLDSFIKSLTLLSRAEQISNKQWEKSKQPVTGSEQEGNKSFLLLNWRCGVCALHAWWFILPLHHFSIPLWNSGLMRTWSGIPWRRENYFLLTLNIHFLLELIYHFKIECRIAYKT